MSTNEPAIADAKSAVLSEADAIKISRKFDMIIVAIVLLVLIGAFHLHAMLTMGDWDFWVDWKDRRYWTTITPILSITFPAAVQYVLWTKFRLPFGAVLCIVALLIGEWINRISGFHMWTNFPYSLVWPATLIPGALILDMVLLLSRNFIATAVIGGMIYGLIFYPGNWPMMAPYLVPIERNGVLMTVADVIGYEYVRTSTPEYLRLIEAGTLRTFGLDVTPVSAFFAAFICALVYMMWWFIGKWFAKTTFVKSL